jgi:regulator of protease activity HflC (stomatin/prohibitin superfamily)
LKFLDSRELLKNTIKDEVETVTSGWGIKIDTVEISDITVSSTKLYSNLQAEFKEKTKIKAMQDEYATKIEIESYDTQKDIENLEKETN